MAKLTPVSLFALSLTNLFEVEILEQQVLI